MVQLQELKLSVGLKHVDILSWMQASMLKQNADKTEVIVFTSEHNAGDSNIKSNYL